MDDLFNQLANISKAHGYDILSEQVEELKKQNAEMRDVLEIIISSPEWIKNYGGGALDKKAKESIRFTKFN